MRDVDLQALALGRYLLADGEVSHLVLALEPDMVLVHPVPPWGVEHRRPVAYHATYLGRLGHDGHLKAPRWMVQCMTQALNQLLTSPSKSHAAAAPELRADQLRSWLVGSSGLSHEAANRASSSTRFQPYGYPAPVLSHKDDLVRTALLYPRALHILQQALHDEVPRSTSSAEVKGIQYLLMMYAWPVASAAAGVYAQLRRASLMFQMDERPRGTRRLPGMVDDHRPLFAEEFEAQFAEALVSNRSSTRMAAVLHFTNEWLLQDADGRVRWSFNKRTVRWGAAQPVPMPPADAPAEFHALAAHLNMARGCRVMRASTAPSNCNSTDPSRREAIVTLDCDAEHKKASYSSDEEAGAAPPPPHLQPQPSSGAPSAQPQPSNGTCSQRAAPSVYMLPLPSVLNDELLVCYRAEHAQHNFWEDSAADAPFLRLTSQYGSDVMVHRMLMGYTHHVDTAARADIIFIPFYSAVSASLRRKCGGTTHEERGSLLAREIKRSLRLRPAVHVIVLPQEAYAPGSLQRLLITAEVVALMQDIFFPHWGRPAVACQRSMATYSFPSARAARQCRARVVPYPASRAFTPTLREAVEHNRRRGALLAFYAGNLDLQSCRPRRWMAGQRQCVVRTALTVAFRGADDCIVSHTWRTPTTPHGTTMINEHPNYHEGMRDARFCLIPPGDVGASLPRTTCTTPCSRVATHPESLPEVSSGC